MITSAGAGESAGRFLDTAHGRIFCMQTRAGGSACVVVVPPFAEEMNKSRRMWTLLAAQLAARGIDTLIPDLRGTGESDGDFTDARWPYWREDLATTCHLARAQGARRIALLGVRLGALLALDFLREAAAAADSSDAIGIEQLILWQPVLSGQQHLNQFLRLKLAAGLRQATAGRETTATLRERLGRGERLEVAGYELARDLVSAIDALDAQVLAPTTLGRVDWLEVSTSAERALLPASARVLERWRAAGVRVEPRVVNGEPFWALQEITIAPELNDVTRDVATEALAA
jgi:exosortase A-associated hydrolase 2